MNTSPSSLHEITQCWIKLYYSMNELKKHIPSTPLKNKKKYSYNKNRMNRKL